MSGRYGCIVATLVQRNQRIMSRKGGYPLLNGTGLPLSDMDTGAFHICSSKNKESIVPFIVWIQSRLFPCITIYWVFPNLA